VGNVVDRRAVLPQKLSKESAVGHRKCIKRGKSFPAILPIEVGSQQSEKVVEGVSSVHAFVHPLVYLREHAGEIGDGIARGGFVLLDCLIERSLQRLVPTTHPREWVLQIEFGVSPLKDVVQCRLK